MTMREYITNAPITVEQVQRKVMDFVRERDNVTIIGAWAVNMYADDVDEEQRQTADIDLMTTDADMQVLLTAYVYAHLGVRLKNHSVYPDLVRLYVDGMNNNKPIVDIVRGTAESEIKEGLRIATIRWQIENKKKAIANPSRAETKRLMDRRDLLVLEAAEGGKEQSPS
jgi:hypothetical protein